MRFPEGEFRGIAPVDDRAIDRLCWYNIRLIRMKREFQKMDGDPAALTATGLVILVLSFRALANPELFVDGRVIWRELKRGIGGWKEHMELIAPSLASEPERLTQLWLFPNALAPED